MLTAAFIGLLVPIAWLLILVIVGKFDPENRRR